jgi:hypothetical protein
MKCLLSLIFASNAPPEEGRATFRKPHDNGGFRAASHQEFAPVRWLFRPSALTFGHPEALNRRKNAKRANFFCVCYSVGICAELKLR